MENANNQPFFAHSGQGSPNIPQTIQTVPQNIHPNESRSVSQSSTNRQYQLYPNQQQQQQQQHQQQQYAAYIQQQQHQRYYAQQQYLIQQQRQQQQYAQQQYWHSVFKQRQQSQYTHYYQQIAQQYGGYPAMLQALNQQNTNNNNMNNSNHRGPIILSSEEQPLLMASDNSKRKRKRRRKKRKISEIDNQENKLNNDDISKNKNIERNETVSIDIEENEMVDDELLGLDKNGYDIHTLINQNECLPDINNSFDEWLYFTKKLWKRQKKYKNSIIYPSNKTNESNNHKNVLDLTDSFSTSDDSLPTDALQINSAFLKDRARMKFKKQKVLKNKSVINVMIQMGLAPPWNQMPKYKKWIKCYKWNQNDSKNN